MTSEKSKSDLTPRAERSYMKVNLHYFHSHKCVSFQRSTRSGTYLCDRASKTYFISFHRISTFLIMHGRGKNGVDRSVVVIKRGRSCAPGGRRITCSRVCAWAAWWVARPAPQAHPAPHPRCPPPSDNTNTLSIT